MAFALTSGEANDRRMTPLAAVIIRTQGWQMSVWVPNRTTIMEGIVIGGPGSTVVLKRVVTIAKSFNKNPTKV